MTIQMARCILRLESENRNNWIEKTIGDILKTDPAHLFSILFSSVRFKSVRE